ncbi:hypothetical protein EI613_17620 [Azospirillum sp. 412522]|nr:hypothetical protein [Azospirillum sp. 412522]MBY6263720.1 hypothetical protein [Azospirillum sp. 412522]
MHEDPAHDLRLSPAEVEEVAAEFKLSPLWVRLALLFRPANRAALAALLGWASGLPLPPA